MNVFFGNLQLKDIVKEQYLEQITEFLDKNGFRRICCCEEVKNREGNYHIYDIPRTWSICGEQKAKELLTFLQESELVADAFKGLIELSVVNVQKY